MTTIDIHEIELSFDETYHVYKGKPLYKKKFKKVMGFHPPGFAAVEDGSGAYHINLMGEPIYIQRYIRTYGFYDGIATVVDGLGYLHIDTTGTPIHNRRFVWAGNFQEGRCVVRDKEGNYFHITKNGTDAYMKRFLYTGDFKYGIAVAYNFDGYATHIDLWGKELNRRKYLELGVYHKGLAIARDRNGYFHIDKKGEEIYSIRFAWVENFYNDYAFARLFDGRMVIIDTKGNIVKEVVGYDTEQVTDINRIKLMEKLSGYWHTQILYAIVKLGILEYIDVKGCSYDFLRNKMGLPENSLDLLINYLLVNNMIKYNNLKYEITPVGKILTENCKKRLKYASLLWGDEHYRVMGNLVDSLFTGQPAFPKLYGMNFFKYLNKYSEKNDVYQKAMEEYSIDYNELIPHFKIPKSVKSIADIGGGHGGLLKKIIKKYPSISMAIIFDLPTVANFTKINLKNKDKIEVVEGNFFESIPFNVDAIIMSRILHDWDDDNAIKILMSVRGALNKKGILYIIETVVPENPTYDCGQSLNFNLFVMVGGRERKLSEFNVLFDKTDFELKRVVFSKNCVTSLMILKRREKL
ncbi:MAG: methyltransferase [Thermoplasmata archaeon]